ncbi:hypothetical protein HNQ54_000430 [Anaerocolumna cellulosilytica]|nr:hypothetical protein [Anaerocolumna cellulosilytica]
MKKYHFRFSASALSAIILILVPNILWMVYPPKNNTLAEFATSTAVEVIMSVSRGLLLVILLFLQPAKQPCLRRSKFYFFFMGICLVIYYISWIFYYLDKTSPYMFLGMAVFPSIFFVLFALWKNNLLGLIPGCLFALLHIGSSFQYYFS